MSIISASLSPNTEPDDIVLTWQVLLSPWKWKTGGAAKKIQEWFEREYDRNIVLFSSGRVALYALLQACHIGKGDEVLLQAFTCVAVPNSIIWNGATPVYVDIDTTFNIDPNEIEKKITPRTKAIIVQHTFGTIAQIEKILTIAKKHNILIIEDCAHTLGATYKGKKVGTYGDAAFFSFGRDKIISSIWGGGVIVGSVLKTKLELVKKFEKNLPESSWFWILQQLLHPVAFSVILPLYDVLVGKLILLIMQHLRLLSKPVFTEELRGGRPGELFVKYPNALGLLAFHQLQKVNRYNNDRQTIAQLYRESMNDLSEVTALPFQHNSIYLRYPILVTDPRQIIKKAKIRGILLGNWYQSIIDPNGVFFESVFYTKGSCPHAEDYAGKIINLPTRINKYKAQKVISFLRDTIHTK